MAFKKLLEKINRYVKVNFTIITHTRYTFLGLEQQYAAP